MKNGFDDSISFPQLEEEIPWVENSRYIANVVRALAKKHGMTQAVLAEKIGVSQQYVSKLLKGQENLSLDTISRLGNALGVNFIASDLYGDYKKEDDGESEKAKAGPMDVVQARPLLTAFPVNDRRVYVNMSSGWMFERTGVVVERSVGSDGKTNIDVTFIDENGDLQLIEKKVDGRYKYVGNVGDTVVPKDFARVFGSYVDEDDDYLDSLLIDVARYFKIDWDKAPDITKIRFRILSDHDIWLHYDGDFFIFCGHYFHKNKLDIWKSDEVTLEESVVSDLTIYNLRMKRPIKLDIDFEPWLSNPDSDEEIQKEIKRLKAFREKYLDKIRHNISSKLAEYFHKDLKVEKLMEDSSGDGKVLAIGLDGNVSGC